MRHQRDMAPGLARALAAATEAPPTSLTLPPEACSVRGIEALSSLETVHVTARTRLGPLARLPRLQHLAVDGRGRRRRRWDRPPRWRDRVRLQPLRGAPALAHLHLYAIEEHIDGGEALSQIPTLRTLEISHSRCPDLSALPGTDLERLELDGVYGASPAQLAGLGVHRLDLWGNDLEDIDVLATMPNLREVWLNGNRVPSLRPLLHLEAGARVYLDGDVDPDQHRADIAALESRGVWLLVSSDPHGNGFSPSWWGSRAPSGGAPDAPIRYVTPGRG